ncbi:sigma-70 family RNA polymerase sigma factor [Shumkonia mesophila]|uniref:sigma-70 family RNA polymerase sigma factor n=1 Tax=Shumkonia mesophila TaxID=2838854 RepID=UPI002934A0BF|nr:sigma-70 family RNA polymerase sigma factor [Shumkonia mesophila]
MERIADGDERAFRLLADRHLGRILRLGRKMLGPTAEVDDVAQEALLRIWMNAGSWRADLSRLTTWIYTIVYRLCLDRLRASRTVSLDLVMEAEDPAPGALETLSRQDDARRLAAAVQLLQPRQRAAVTLFYYEELSGEDAAAVMHVSLRAFWSLLHRARQTVQQHLQESLSPSMKVDP